jgi:Tfp pilus assembly protein PilX
MSLNPSPVEADGRPIFRRRGTSLSARRPSGSRSAALILTLSMLVLITIMVVGFISIVSEDRSATQNYTQSEHAQEIALGGLDQIVAQIRGEITDPNLNASTNGSGANVMYIPNSTNAVPERMVSDALLPIVTLSGTNFYDSAANFASAGNFTTNASLNNRSVSVSRWCKPQLLFPSATNGFIAPSWIVVTRAGPKAFSAGTAPVGAGLTVSGLANMNEAVGRYAYVVYDTSGLMDINAAGYPGTAATMATLKGVVPWADLTQLSANITQADIDGLVDWRNAANSSAYPSYVTNTWTTNGFTWVAPGDTTFLSRQELIQYAQNQNTDLTNALPYLTTFSRELNGPTWGPTTNLGSYSYLANEDSAGAANPLIFNPRVAAGGWTRDNGTTAVTGEPLVKYRFPLGKLSLLDQGTDTASIKQYFGLVPASDFSTTYRHWIYTSPDGTGTTAAASIKTLDEISGREPDFFELLQAGILAGSLGQSGRSDSSGVSGNAWANPSNMGDPDRRTDYQIIRIGANIIDQTHADSYPTTITYGTSSDLPNGANFYGVEDLPYLNKLFMRVNGTGAPWKGSIPSPPYSFYLYFELWNPNQTNGTYAGYPTKFQIEPVQGPNVHDQYGIGLAGPGPFSGDYDLWPFRPSDSAWQDPVPGGWTIIIGANNPIPFTAAATDYREPAVIPGPIINLTNHPAAPLSQDYAAYFLGTVPSFPIGLNDSAGDLPPWSENSSTYQQNLASISLQVVLQVQYQDAGGTYRTYGTFMGLNDPNDQNGSGYIADLCVIPMTPDDTINTPALAKSDPRTFRFGVGESVPANTGGAIQATSEGHTLTPAASTLVSPVWGNDFPFPGNLSDYPFQGSVNTGGTGANPYRMDMWAVNASGVSPSGTAFASGTTPYYSDLDGVQRPGDARYSYPSSSPYFTGATPSRPIILHRPFASVGELGYVFRDMPWKTLDLSSPNSADAALLDLFTVSDAPVVAGRVNPNTAPAPVLSALLSGTLANYSGSNTNLATSDASTIAQAITNAVSAAPFLNRASLVSGLATNSAITSAAVYSSGIKVEREAVVRALAESANTRTWNFLVDIIAQSGSYPTTAATLDNFNVTGERRYWLHIAIDRYTGQIVDKQLEMVNE